MKNIAIIIDAWAGRTQQISWIQDIINLISQNQTIDSVILATYDIANEFENAADTIWYTNFKKFNLGDLFANMLIAHDLQHNFTHPKLAGKLRYEEQQTHHRILNHWWPDKFQIAAFHPYQLNLDSIKNVYFFGAAWDTCVMTRPLGWKWWIEFTNTNLFAYEKRINLPKEGVDKTIWLEQEKGLYQFDRNSR
jgi:hypothetical protein